MTLDLRSAYAGRLITDPAEMAPFLTDWRREWTGRAIAVAQPATTAEVADLLAWCSLTGAPVTPQGGNTGLSGASVPDVSGRGLVLSLARMDRVRAIDTVNNTITLDAGVTLGRVKEAAAEAGRLFPLSLAAEGACTIGGNLATNAGGTAVLRYGNARDLCLGLEVVTASGEVWDGLRGLRKDNTGYALKDLFVGSEGTLGVITGAVMKLYPAPKGRHVAFIAVQTLQDALRLLTLAQTRLGAELTAFELVSRFCVELVERHVPGARRPLALSSPWYVLAEATDASGDAAAARRFEDWLSAAAEEGLAADAVIAASTAQANALWALRERVSDAQGREGRVIKHDVSAPLSALPALAAQAGAAVLAIVPEARLGVFGHLGDGNLHFNVLPPQGSNGDDLLGRLLEVNGAVHGVAVSLGGSISAEHGVGVLRRDEGLRMRSSVEVSMMRAIKVALDPQGLMNPGKGLV